ncbi:MAG: endonuclease/exonuclease/phosphatase family protein [Candidatus Ozemobacteraceae bacterium]
MNAEIQQNSSEQSVRPNFFIRLFMAFFYISVIGVFCGFLSSAWWVFEVLSSFRVQYALILATGCIISLWRKNRSAVFLSSVLCISNCYPLYPYMMPMNEEPHSSRILKITSVNVHSSNKRYDKVLEYIASQQPDICLFTEVNQLWAEKLKPLEKAYPHCVSKIRNDNFGIALYTKIQPQHLEIVDFLAEELPSVSMTFLMGSETIYLIGTHPLPPRTYQYTACRNAQIETIATHFSKISGKKILIGDLNTPPWVDLFRNLLRVGGLKDTALGRGIQLTWPMQAWWFLGIPIDHCLVSPEWNVLSRRIGPEVGSDHYPLYVELGIP